MCNKSLAVTYDLTVILSVLYDTATYCICGTVITYAQRAYDQRYRITGDARTEYCIHVASPLFINNANI